MGTQGTNYLFGDSTPSTLRTNFLEFVRDALDFSVFVVQADARIQDVEQRIANLRKEADAEMDRLDVFVSAVTRAINETPKGGANSPTSRCAEHLTTLASEALRTSLNGVRQKLAGEIAEAEAEIAMERAASLKALGGLLAPHDPPDATTSTEVVLGDGGVYQPANSGSSPLGLAWRFELAVGEAPTWSSILRVERFAPLLEIKTPQLSGWISKEVKIKPQKIDKHVVTELSDDGTVVRFNLRLEPTLDSGFDVEVDMESGDVSLSRVDNKPDAKAGAFDVDEGDAPKLLELAQKLRASLGELKREHLLEATLDGADFAAAPRFVPFVESLVGMMAPIVREIAERSLTPNELVIRRLLGNDRREEIFVTKAALREKYAPLSSAQRAIFAPLGLDAPAPATRRVSIPADPAPVQRAELRPSAPPPAPSKAPPAAEGALPAPPAMPSESMSPNPSSMSLRIPGQGAPTEALKAALKKIIGYVKRGATEEAYQGYKELFASEDLAAARPDDQRAALRLMVLAKTPPPTTPAVLDAHRAALVRLQALVDLYKEPADYEMLGVCQALLDQEEAAKASFAAGLSLEESRNPSSELYSKLVRRVRQGSPEKKEEATSESSEA